MESVLIFLVAGDSPERKSSVVPFLFTLKVLPSDALGCGEGALDDASLFGASKLNSKTDGTRTSAPLVDLSTLAVGWSSSRIRGVEWPTGGLENNVLSEC